MSNLNHKQWLFLGVLTLFAVAVLPWLVQTNDNEEQNLSWESRDSAFNQLQQDTALLAFDPLNDEAASSFDNDNTVAETQEPTGLEAKESADLKPEAIARSNSADYISTDDVIVEPKTKVALNDTGTGTKVSRSGQTNTRKYSKTSKVNGSFGSFHYRELGGGRIEVDPVWISENIVTINLPGLNRKVQVNKAAADNFIKAFTLIKNGTATINGRQVSLLSLIKTMDGTFVTRHVNWNPANGLSNHSWGTAIDINANNHFRYVNPASEPNDPNVILWEKAFKPAGFSWGNRYSDAMHYELLK